MSKFEAKNDLTSREMFVQRSYYGAYAYSPRPEIDFYLFPENTHNSWYREFMLYGKVDRSFFGLPIQPYKPYMKSLSTKRSAVQTLNFVADAFVAFQKEYLLQIQAGKLSGDDPMLAEINPVKGFVSVNKLHHDSQKLLSDRFEKYSKSFEIKSKINDLDEFIGEMLYALEAYPGVPFTTSAFVMSRFCPPLISGLSIEIMDAPYSEDKLKKEMIDSPNFQGYVITAANHGFMIDKNIPWRLIANLKSEYMLARAREYQPDVQNQDDIIKYFFKLTAENELDNFKSHMLRLYNSFAANNPINATMSGPPDKLVKRRQSRPRYTLQKLNDLYDDSFWLELYIRIRNSETQLNYPKPALDGIIRVAKDIQKTLDTPNAMGYTISKFSGFDFYEGSLAHSAESIKQTREGLNSQTAKEVVTARARSARKIFF